MITNHHTPIPTGANANASVINSPLSQLDSAISNLSGGWNVLQSRAELSASASSIALSGISTAYELLILELELRSDGATAVENLDLTLNGDSTAANYAAYSIRTSGTTPTVAASQNAGSNARYRIPAATGASATANYFGFIRIEISAYATTGNRGLRGLGTVVTANTTGNLSIVEFSGLYAGSAAITNLDVAPVTGSNWVAGSAYTLYALGSV